MHPFWGYLASRIFKAIKENYDDSKRAKNILRVSGNTSSDVDTITCPVCEVEVEVGEPICPVCGEELW